ncbi:MAG TPA: alanine racemase [Azospirillaceae bacterium]|nr:alanine racemase [Azospirillaceae bacterium]
MVAAASTSEEERARRSAGAILTVDLDAVVANWRLIRDRVAPAVASAVVKADAYGLGMVPVVRALAAAGCTRFFVAQLQEAIALRAVVPDADIMNLGGLLPGTGADHLDSRVTPVLNGLGEIERWRAHGPSHGQARAAVIHIDTGMNRLGLGPDELDRLAGGPERLAGVPVLAWMTHLACGDEADNPMNPMQRGRFLAACERLPPAPRCLANSGGVFLGTDYHLDMVRPGCALYGVNPLPARSNPMRPTIRLDARVLQVRNVDSPMTVGYGAVHRVARKGRIATIALGYADGYMRALGGRGHVFVAGLPAPVVGRISMDLITVDVTDLPEGTVAPGTLVEVIGPNRTVDQVAAEAGTIGYEILTSLGGRYHRVHTGAGMGV